MRKKDMISVIVPIYNGALYLHRCLESILNNTYQNIEVICINDGSRDESLQILQEYERKDSRVVIINQENQGVAAARNAGLALAKGEFVTFVDADDWIHKAYFEVLHYIQNDTNADIVSCKRVHDSEDDDFFDVKALAQTDYTFRECLSNTNGEKQYVTGKLYKYAIIQSQQFNKDMKIAEDLLFNVELFVKHPSFSLVQLHRVLYYYYWNPNSVTHTASDQTQVNVNRQLFDYYISKIPQETDSEIQNFLTHEAIKQILSNRYAQMFNPRQDIVRNETRSRWKKCKQWLKNMPRTDQIKYMVLIKCPWIYRIWRIQNDPTMLQWEKNQKEKAKQYGKR